MSSNLQNGSEEAIIINKFNLRIIVQTTNQKTNQGLQAFWQQVEQVDLVNQLKLKSISPIRSDSIRTCTLSKLNQEHLNLINHT